MSLNLLHIAEAWAKTFKLMDVSEEDRIMSRERLKICAKCDHARESKVLEIIRGSIERMDTIYCDLCICPCHEKSIIKKEKCPDKNW